jgi:hypothetical protein
MTRFLYHQFEPNQFLTIAYHRTESEIVFCGLAIQHLKDRGSNLKLARRIAYGRMAKLMLERPGAERLLHHGIMVALKLRSDDFYYMFQATPFTSRKEVLDTLKDSIQPAELKAPPPLELQPYPVTKIEPRQIAHGRWAVK